MFYSIGISFMPTQIPLGIFEGIITAAVYQFIAARRPGLLEGLGKKPEQPVLAANRGEAVV